MYGQKYGRKLVKPLRIENNRRMGKRETKARQSSERLQKIYFIDLDDEEHREVLKNAMRKLEKDLLGFPKGTTKVFAKSETASEKTPKNVFSMYSGIS